MTQPCPGQGLALLWDNAQNDSALSKKAISVMHYCPGQVLITTQYCPGQVQHGSVQSRASA